MAQHPDLPHVKIAHAGEVAKNGQIKELTLVQRRRIGERIDYIERVRIAGSALGFAHIGRIYVLRLSNRERRDA